MSIRVPLSIFLVALATVNLAACQSSQTAQPQAKQTIVATPKGPFETITYEPTDPRLNQPLQVSYLRPVRMQERLSSGRYFGALLAGAAVSALGGVNASYYGNAQKQAILDDRTNAANGHALRIENAKEAFGALRGKERLEVVKRAASEFGRDNLCEGGDVLRVDVGGDAENLQRVMYNRDGSLVLVLGCEKDKIAAETSS